MSDASPSRVASTPPPPAELFCEVRSVAGTTIVAPHGELDLASASRLDEALHDRSQEGARHLVVDLRGLSFIDACGLSLLARWRRRANRAETRLSVIAGSPTIQRVLELTALDEVLEFVSEEDLPVSTEVVA